MALPGKVGIRVKQTTKTTGTVGPYALEPAPANCLSFVQGIGNGNTALYCCTDIDPESETGNWEVGYGVVTDSTPDTVARTTIIASSNGGSPVNWPEGTRDIFSTFIHSGILLAVNNLSDLQSASAARTNLGLGSAAIYDTGAGNNLDADSVDGLHAAGFVRLEGDQTITGNKTFNDSVTCQGNVDVDGTLDCNQTNSTFVLPVGLNRFDTV